MPLHSPARRLFCTRLRNRRDDMRFARFGDRGQERPAVLDAEGRLRDAQAARARGQQQVASDTVSQLNGDEWVT